MPDYQTKIGHAHLKVHDLAASIKFYQRYFSLTITEHLPGHYAFLTGTHMHHELALQQVGQSAPRPAQHSVGLYHVAFEVPDKYHFAQVIQLLAQDGIPFSAVDHRISWAVYFSDPSGNGLEIYVDTRVDHDNSLKWSGQSFHLTQDQIAPYLQGDKHDND